MSAYILNILHSSRLLIGLEPPTQIVVTRTSTTARSVLEEPSTHTTMRRMRAPSSWWTRPDRCVACMDGAGSSGGVANLGLGVDLVGDGILT